MLTRALTALMAAGLLHLLSPTSAASSPIPPSRGVNVLGYDPIWEDAAKARMTAQHFQLIREAGFTSVRINLRAFQFMDANDRLPAHWFQVLDWAIAEAHRNGLSVVIDEHDFRACSTDAAICRRKLLAFWSQVAPRYRNEPNSVAFELLNEPYGALRAGVWNRLLREVLAEVRTTNPHRSVIVGPVGYNSPDYLGALDLPADDNLIVTVHYYAPDTFTQQGAAWRKAPPNAAPVAWGSASDRARVQRDFDAIQRWSILHKRRIYLGEFGADEKGDAQSRAAYAATVSRAAERRGWSWAWWQFDSDFVLYDIKADRWVAPVLGALIPCAGSAPQSQCRARTAPAPD